MADSDNNTDTKYPRAGSGVDIGASVPDNTSGAGDISPNRNAEPSESGDTVDDASNSGIGGSGGKYEDPTIGINPKSRKRSQGRGGDDGTSAGTSHRKTTQEKTGKVDVSKTAQQLFAKQLVGIHAIIGIATQAPGFWAITPEQGEQMSEAIYDVMRQYDLQIDPKKAAWGKLIFVFGSVYGLKIYAYRQIKKSSQPDGSNIRPIKPQQPAAGKNDGSFKMSFE